MKSKCQLSHMPSETCRGDSFIVNSRFQCLLTIPTIPWLADTLLQPLLLITWPSFLRYLLHHLSSVFYSLYLCSCHLLTSWSRHHSVQMQWEFKSSSLSHPTVLYSSLSFNGHLDHPASAPYSNISPPIIVSSFHITKGTICLGYVLNLLIANYHTISKSTPL